LIFFSLATVNLTIAVEVLLAAAGMTTANIVELNYYATQATDFPTLVQIRQWRWAFDPAPSVTAIAVSAVAGRNI
jgi:hypothetical protein